MKMKLFCLLISMLIIFNWLGSANIIKTQKISYSNYIQINTGSYYYTFSTIGQSDCELWTGQIPEYPDQYGSDTNTIAFYTPSSVQVYRIKGEIFPTWDDNNDNLAIWLGIYDLNTQNYYFTYWSTLDGIENDQWFYFDVSFDSMLTDFFYFRASADFQVNLENIKNGELYVSNNPPDKPSSPEGPDLLGVGETGTFTSGTTDPDGDDIFYEFNWDNNDWYLSSWVESGESVTVSYNWDIPGNYYVCVRAEDIHYFRGEYSESLCVIVNGPPIKPSTPEGPGSLEIGDSGKFTTFSTDPNDEGIRYMWNWGDGTYSGWLGPFDSGDDASASHIWNTEGDFNIKVKAKDVHDMESEGWSDSICITIVDDPVLGFSPEYIYFGEKLEGWSGTKTFDVWNKGTGILNYRIAEGCNWFTVEPDSGDSRDEHETIKVKVDSDGLDIGSYNGVIFIDSLKGGSGEVNVTVRIREPKSDLVVGDDIKVFAVPGENISCDFYIYNRGEKGSILDWKIVRDSFPEDWGYNWNCTPWKGDGLTTDSDGCKVVLEFEAPTWEDSFDNKDSPIKIVNRHNTGDNDSLNVICITEKSRNRDFILPLFFHKFFSHFPYFKFFSLSLFR